MGGKVFLLFYFSFFFDLGTQLTFSSFFFFLYFDCLLYLIERIFLIFNRADFFETIIITARILNFFFHIFVADMQTNG